MVGKQTGGMPILSKPKQNQVKFWHFPNFLCIHSCGGLSTEFGRNDMYVFSRNIDSIQPGRGRHLAIAFPVIAWPAAFIAKPDVPESPVVLPFGQRAIEFFRCSATSQDNMKFTSISHGGTGGTLDPGQSSVQPLRIGYDVPARLGRNGR